MVKERMGIKELGQEVAQEIEKRIPEARVEVREVNKNNSLILHGLTIMDESKETNIAPTIYLDNFFQQYLNDEVTVEEIVERVIEMNEMHQPEIPFHIELVTKFENVRNNLRIKLVNTKKNEEMLKDVPHKEILDLSAIYQIAVLMDDDSVGTVTISNRIFEKYGITVDELHEAAIENMKNIEPAQIKGMFQTMAELMGEEMGELPMDMFGDEEEKMLVITNKSKVCGASVILQKETLQKITDIFKQDFYILPSSIHEVLAVKADGNGDASVLRDMVKEVNDTQVAQEELLSYNVYYYSSKTGELSIA